MYSACFHGNLELVRQLLAEGANLEYTNRVSGQANLCTVLMGPWVWVCYSA